MFNLIVGLRRKPERVRRQVAFLVALSFTVVLALLWLVTFSATVGGRLGAAPAGAREETSPLAALGEAADTFFSDLQSTVSQLRENFSAPAGAAD